MSKLIIFGLFFISSSTYACKVVENLDTGSIMEKYQIVSHFDFKGVNNELCKIDSNVSKIEINKIKVSINKSDNQVVTFSLKGDNCMFNFSSEIVGKNLAARTTIDDYLFSNDFDSMCTNLENSD